MAKKKVTNVSFGSALSRLIENADISKVDLGKAVDVSHAAIGNYVAGRVPKAETLHKIADYFGVSPEGLLVGDVSPRAEGSKTYEVKNLQFTLALDRATVAEHKLARLQELLREMVSILGDGSNVSFATPAKKNLPREVASNFKHPAKAKRTRLRDIDTISLAILGNIPAGWPQEGEGALSPVRVVRVRRGRFPEGAFGLIVRGDSMNAATPEPILDGEVVVLVSPEQREPRSSDIVAALIDGETALKRLVNGDQPAHLVSESSNPAFGKIYPLCDLRIQGVFVGKLTL